MRRLTIFLLALLAALPARAAENEILLQNGEIRIAAPNDWVILAHSPTGHRTVIAFQVFGNEAEVGTPAATNLTISTFALKDPDSAQAFMVPTTRKSQEDASTREYEGWSIREWQGDQDGTKYEIHDARLANRSLHIGILVRLAWPLLENNPPGYEEKMKAIFKSMLDSIARKNPEKS